MRGLLAILCLLAAGAASGAERLHLLIPAGPGGGLDSTARAIGQALQAGDIRAPVSYENMTGGGGGRALGHFVETAERQRDTLLINSTPLIVRSLQGLFANSYRDLVPIAALVAEYNAIVVRADSEFGYWADLAEALRSAPGKVLTGGGSVRGSLDHIVMAMAAQRAGVDARSLRYLPYDGGGKAMLALLGGEIEVLCTGLGESAGYVGSGDVRVLAITAPERSALLPDAPTLTELGVPVVFANWRGLFAAPGTTAQTAELEQAEIRAARQRPEWQQALKRYGWSDLALEGDAFRDFLAAQESELKRVLTSLGFIR